MREALSSYAADVVELLLADGFPAAVSSVVGPRGTTGDVSPGLDDLDLAGVDLDAVDGHALLGFPPDVAARFGGVEGLRGVSLRWGGLSGWRVCGTTVLCDVERWLGAGLTPSASAVANFAVTASVDLAAAGSEDRPFYRAPGADLSELSYRVTSASTNYTDPGDRIRDGRLQTCWSGASRDILTGQGDSAIIVVTDGELQALQRLVDLTVDLDGTYEHLRTFARLLVQDWRTRSTGPVQESQLAYEYAALHRH